MNKIKFENFGKGNKKSGKNSKSFYIALAVCITAVGVAAWSTYSSVMDYLNPKQSSTVLNGSSDTPTDKSVSGVKDNRSNASSKTESPTSSGDSSAKSDENASGPKKDDLSAENSQAESAINGDGDNQAVQTGTTVSPEPTAGGALVYPVGKIILKDYSGETPVFSKTFGDWRVHSGIDFAADKGATVKAMAGGVVKEVYEDDMLGTTVVIEHNGGFVACYSGLGKTTMVKAGDGVDAGDVIGSVNDVPAEQLEETHLHLETKVGGVTVNPLDLLDNRE